MTNHRAEPAQISTFSAIEFCLWDAQDDASNFQRNFNTGQVEVDAAAGVIYHKTEYRERRDHFAYFACSAPLTGFDTQRDAFLGPTAAGTTPRPWRSAVRPTLSHTAGSRSARTTSS